MLISHTNNIPLQLWHFVDRLIIFTLEYDVLVNTYSLINHILLLAFVLLAQLYQQLWLSWLQLLRLWLLWLQLLQLWLLLLWLLFPDIVTRLIIILNIYLVSLFVRLQKLLSVSLLVQIIRLMIDVATIFLYHFTFGSDRLHDIIMFFHLLLAVTLLVIFFDDQVIMI